MTMCLCVCSSLSLQYRWNILRNIRNAIDQNEGGLEKFSQGEHGGVWGGGRHLVHITV